jgi:hypothetical protein
LYYIIQLGTEVVRDVCTPHLKKKRKKNTNSPIKSKKRKRKKRNLICSSFNYGLQENKQKMFLNFSQTNSKSLTTSTNISRIPNSLQRREMRMKEIESQTNYKFENKRCAYMSSLCLSGYGGNQLVNCLILFVIFLMVVYVIVG